MKKIPNNTEEVQTKVKLQGAKAADGLQGDVVKLAQDAAVPFTKHHGAKEGCWEGSPSAGAPAQHIGEGA